MFPTELNVSHQKELDDALIVVRNKYTSYLQKISVYDVAMMYEAGNSHNTGENKIHKMYLERLVRVWGKVLIH